MLLQCGGLRLIIRGYFLFIGLSYPSPTSSIFPSSTKKEEERNVLMNTYSHIEWHVEAGLTATLFEAPNLLQGNLTIPADHLAVCKTDGTPTVGNAAGNDKNWFNLQGAPTSAPRYDYGYVPAFLPAFALFVCFWVRYVRLMMV
jgi:hypothetical protein